MPRAMSDRGLDDVSCTGYIRVHEVALVLDGVGKHGGNMEHSIKWPALLEDPRYRLRITQVGACEAESVRKLVVSHTIQDDHVVTVQVEPGAQLTSKVSSAASNQITHG